MFFTQTSVWSKPKHTIAIYYLSGLLDLFLMIIYGRLFALVLSLDEVATAQSDSLRARRQQYVGYHCLL